jgi:hypothetical protein
MAMIKELSLQNTQLNATMRQVRMKVLLYAGLFSFHHFEIYD